MAGRTLMRASDGEREQIAERLRQAAAEGRILASELETRLALALRARTLGELDRLVADLPHTSRSRGRRGALPSVGVAVTYAAVAICVLSVLAVVAVVLAGFFAVWAFWALVAWWCFGRGRRAGRRFGGHSPLSAASRRGLL